MGLKELFDRPWQGNAVPLREIDAQAAKRVQGLLRLDELCDGLHASHMGDFIDRLNQGRIDSVGLHIAEQPRQS